MAFYCALSLAATQGRCPAPPSPPLPLSRARAAPAVRSAVQRAPFFTVYMELSGVACRSSSYIPYLHSLLWRHLSTTAGQHTFGTPQSTRARTHTHTRADSAPTHPTLPVPHADTRQAHTLSHFSHTHTSRTHAHHPPARPGPPQALSLPTESRASRASTASVSISMSSASSWPDSAKHKACTTHYTQAVCMPGVCQAYMCRDLPEPSASSAMNCCLSRSTVS